MTPTKKAFTLMELIVVVVIIAMIAAFAIPNYDKAMEKAREKDAATQLRTLHTAVRLYNAHNGSYWVTGATPVSDLATINSTLNINLMAGSGASYSYLSQDGSIFSAAISWQPASIRYTISVDEEELRSSSSPYNPCCSSLNCVYVPNC